MEFIIDNIFEFLLKIFSDPRIVVAIIAFLPIAEARLAIPVALSYGLNPFESFLYGFIGSSITIPILLITLMPLVEWLTKTKLFKKIGFFLKTKFGKKAQKVIKSDTALNSLTEKSEASGETAKEIDITTKKTIPYKTLIGLSAFVALPLPLTGVWSGSAIASILKLPFLPALIAVTAGNLIASVIITLISVYFEKYINIIIAVIALIIIIAILYIIFKIVFFKEKNFNNIKNDKH